MKPTQEQVIQWAREAGVGKAFVCAKPDECPDDDGCCHQNKQDGYWVRDDKFLAALTLAYEAGRKDENEACAELCEQPIDEIQITDDCSEYKYRDNQECADAIRTRREQ